MLKRGYIGTFHKMSPKHLNRCVTAFEGRHNVREMDTINQMGSLPASCINFYSSTRSPRST